MSEEVNSDIHQGENYFQWISNNAKLVNQENEQITFEVFSDKKFLGIYFAASWIPVSKNYLQIIDNAVNAMETRDDTSMGVLLASCDQKDEDMMEFVSTANVTYPIISPKSNIIESLKEKFEIEEIPILVVLNVENNSIVDKVDKLRLENLLEKENPDAMCDLWLGIVSADTLDEASPSPDNKLKGKEKKQQAKADKDRLKKEASEKKKQEKIEKTEQKKIAKFEKQKSKEIKKLKTKNLDDTTSLNSQSLAATDEPTSPIPVFDKDISPLANATGVDDVLTIPLPYNTVREGSGNLSDSSNGSIDLVSGKIKKKKRNIWGRTETPKQKDPDVQISTLMQKNNELEHLVSEHKLNKQELEIENKELHAQVDSLNGIIADRDNGLKALEYRNTELSSQLLASGENNKALNEEKERMVLELVGVETNLSQTKEELKNTQNRMEEIEQEKQMIETEHQKFLELNELSGWMHKRGRKSFTRGMWRNRYFQAGEGFKLYYYKSPKMKTPRGNVNLGDVIKVEPVENSKSSLLTISTESSSLELRAPDDATRDTWISSITFLTQYCKKHRPSNEESLEVKVESKRSVEENATAENKEGSTEVPKASESIEISPVTAN